MKTSLSVLVPVYNEQHLVYTSLQRLKILDTSDCLDRIEIIVVDDCSTDDSPAVLKRFRDEQTGDSDSKIQWIFLRHERNGGKGQAVQTALECASCEISVIHDADLEYHPKDLLRIVKVFTDESADAVYGSRFAGSEVRRILFYRHQLGNKFLTFLTNLATNLNLTDMETCYKAIRTDLFQSIPLESNDFRIEPEITLKLAKRRARIFEVPISYSGRTYEEGKKINWRDGFRALAALVKFTLSNRIYAGKSQESKMVTIAEAIGRYCGSRVCEIVRMSDLSRLHKTYDTVICTNLDQVDDELGVLTKIREALIGGGNAIVVVPNIREPRHRYTKDYLRRLGNDSGLTINNMVEFNSSGSRNALLIAVFERSSVFAAAQDESFVLAKRAS